MLQNKGTQFALAVVLMLAGCLVWFLGMQSISSSGPNTVAQVCLPTGSVMAIAGAAWLLFLAVGRAFRGR